jgi:DnaJ-class molecular chaperone
MFSSANVTATFTEGKMTTDKDMIEDYTLGVSTSSNIQVCPMCLGKGYLTKEELICHHGGDYGDVSSACGTCEGMGLVEKVTKEVVVLPKRYYKTSPKIFYLPYNAKEEVVKKLSADGKK